MLFTLEAVKAEHGDALLLHYGTLANPKLVVIDGGPRDVYDHFLEPRLRQIRRLLGVSGRLPVRLGMISHLDSDHITGIQDLLEDIDQSANPLLRIQSFWHNAFDDNLRTNQLSALASFGRLSTAGIAAIGSTPWHAGLAASFGRSRTVRRLLRRLRIQTNAGGSAHRGFVAAGDRFNLGSGLSMRILGPTSQQLGALQTDWDATVGSLAGLSGHEQSARIAAYLDTSVANLSSIVALATKSRKKILLTGDARGDHILRSIGRARLFRRGKLSVDILKVPHHGSDRNVDVDFFRRITARHYVFSGDGSNGNPDRTTLQMITEARGAARYTMHFTYKLRANETFLRSDRRSNNRNYTVEHVPRGERSVWVDLGDALDF